MASFNSLDFLNHPSLDSSRSSLVPSFPDEGFDSPDVTSSGSLEERIMFIALTIPDICCSISCSLKRSTPDLPKLYDRVQHLIAILNQEIPVLEASLATLSKRYQNQRTVDALTDRALTPSQPPHPSAALVDLPIKSDRERAQDSFVYELTESATTHSMANTVQKTHKTLLNCASVMKHPAAQTAIVAGAIFAGQSPIATAPTRVIGRGAFGVVSEKRVLDVPYAAKQLLHGDLKQEYVSLTTFEHPCIISLALVDADHLTLYLELAAHGSLKHRLSSKSSHPLSRSEWVKILTQTATAIHFIHSKNYIHRDIKADNVLLTDSHNAKLSDLGTAIAIEDFDPESLAGTVPYLPVEYLRGECVEPKKIDVWSFGLLIWQHLKQPHFVTPFLAPATANNPERIHGKYSSEMSFISHITNERNFTGFKEDELRAQLDPTQIDRYDPHLILTRLMERCLSYDPAARPSMEEVVAILSAAK